MKRYKIKDLSDDTVKRYAVVDTAGKVLATDSSIAGATLTAVFLNAD